MGWEVQVLREDVRWDGRWEMLDGMGGSGLREDVRWDGRFGVQG